MNHNKQQISWIWTGGVCGLLGGLLYFAAAFLTLPPLLTYIAAFAFGPLLAIGCAGLYYFLPADIDTPGLKIAVISAVAGAVVLLLMLTVQQSLFAAMDDADTAGYASKEMRQTIHLLLNSIHWGMDIAWDILISLTTVLFGYSMLRKKWFWKIFGATGSILGLLLLSFNLYHFPQPPASVQSIDWGPFVAIWYLAAFASILIRIKKISLNRV